jgi:hypothetical protein
MGLLGRREMGKDLKVYVGRERWRKERCDDLPLDI